MVELVACGMLVVMIALCLAAHREAQAAHQRANRAETDLLRIEDRFACLQDDYARLKGEMEDLIHGGGLDDSQFNGEGPEFPTAYDTGE